MVEVQNPVVTDALTGLPGRRGFEQAFEETLKQASMENRPVSVSVVDIDLLGRINAAHGRATGDAVIQMVASRIGDAFGSEVTAYRFGGDAIGMLFDSLEKEQAFLRLEAFREAFTGAHAVMVERNALELNLSVSAGVASYPDDGAKAPEIMLRASEALYRAKVSGRNKVCLAREERMVTKTSHYTQGQLMGLRRLAEREGYGEASLLREALNDMLRKYNA